MKSKKSTPGGKQQNHSKTSLRTFKVFTTEQFISEACELKKKYPHIGDDFHTLLAKLKSDPFSGNDPLGKDCYKIRMRISDKNSGERDGARVIVKVKVIDGVVYLMSVYDKSVKSNLYEGELDKIIANMVAKHDVR
ncbi:hypothetical protein [Chitinophaga japonensis]|uniref:mRNA-degrading endonuclease RelE of RelBE toxin-antitoxin system n=1 Tax=Chitinophaga japonensis TaxID=104662 RepID=A0A562SYM7_CHIJA|nr:hypothetical protein [Chitinophaga japonensis]TWI86283.1 hypothetical protein LX66_3537 [Chitinophaga japonensis]